MRETLSKYLKALAASGDQDSLLPIYLRQRRPKRLYVDPDVYPQATKPRRRAPRQSHPGKRTNERVPWETVFQKPLSADRPWRFVILGKRGQGKSLLLRIQGQRLALKALKMLRDPTRDMREIPIPVVARLADLVTCVPPTDGEEDSVRRHLLERMMRQGLGTGSELNQLVEYALHSAAPRQLWLFLDGLDEVTDRSMHQRYLAVLAGLECHVLISSQLHAYQAIPLPFQARPFTLAPFSRKQIMRFVGNWCQRKDDAGRIFELIKAARVLDYMASNPFLLTWLCWSCEKHRLSSSVTRSQVYEQVLRDILGLPIDAVAAPDGQRATVCLPILSDIALQARWKGNEHLMPTDWLLDFFQSSSICPTVGGRPAGETVHFNAWQTAEYLLEEFRLAGLLVPANAERTAYFFPHKSLADYLAARWLADALEGRRTITVKPPHAEAIRCSQQNAWDILDKLAWSPRWEEVVIFVAGRLRDPSPLLQMLFDSRNDDHFRHRLALAVLCLGEISSDTLATHAQLAKSILEAFFEKWWHTLLHGEVRAYRIRNYPRAIRIAAYLDSGATSNGLRASLANMMHDQSPVIRRGAINTVKFIGSPACIPAILDGLAKNLRGELLGFTATAIAHLGDGAARTDIVHGLLAGLGKGSQRHAITNALDALGRTEARGKMVEVLQKGLHAATHKERWQAAEALGRIDLKATIDYIYRRIYGNLRQGSSQRMASKTVHTLLEPGFRSMAREVCDTNQLDHKAMTFAQRFEPLLGDHNDPVRVIAAWVLTVSGLADRRATFNDVLFSLLKSDQLCVRLLALDVVGMRGQLLGRPDAAVTLLDLAVANRFAAGRVGYAVSRFGSTGIMKSWAQYWRRLANDPNMRGLATAMRILRQCKDVTGTTGILNCLADIRRREPAVPEHLLGECLATVCRLGKSANRNDIVQCLVVLTATEKPAIRSQAIKALGALRVDPLLPAVSAALARLISDETPAVRRAATSVAGRLRAKSAQEALDDLSKQVITGPKAARRKVARIVGCSKPEVVSPEILQRMMAAAGKRTGEKHSSWRGIAMLMNGGFRVFEQPQDEHGQRWVARTTRELSRVDTGLSEAPVATPLAQIGEGRTNVGLGGKEVIPEAGRRKGGRPRDSKIAQRNKKIVAANERGDSVDQISHRFNITAELVRQVLFQARKQSGSPPHERRHES